MSFKSVTTTIELLLAALPLAAGRRQLSARLDRTFVRNVLSRKLNQHSVKRLRFNHDGELITTSPEGQNLANNGLLVAASNPIQSMSDVGLDRGGRSNNKKSTYKIHQDELSDLYGSRADSLIIYPLLLINNCERNENRGKLKLVTAADKWNLAGEDQLIIGTHEVSLENYEKGWGVAFVMVLLHNLRGLYCLAKYRLADFAEFLTAFLSPSAARNAEFLTTVFQPLRYVLVQAYGRLVHCLCREDRTAVNTQKQQPLFELTNGSSRLWNYCSFRMITSRYLAVTWEETHVAAQAA